MTAFRPTDEELDRGDFSHEGITWREARRMLDRIVDRGVLDTVVVVYLGDETTVVVGTKDEVGQPVGTLEYVGTPGPATEHLFHLRNRHGEESALVVVDETEVAAANAFAAAGWNMYRLELQTRASRLVFCDTGTGM